MQERLVEMLKKIVIFFEENNIEYYVIGGTLLETIRHQGFIPWDDDIDIGIPEGSYRKLIKLCRENQRVISGLTICFQETCNKFYHPYAKIYNDSSTLIETGLENDFIGGVYIDLFPLYGSSLILKKTEQSVKYVVNRRRILSLKKSFKGKTRVRSLIRNIFKPFAILLISNKRTNRKINNKIVKTKMIKKEIKFLVNYFGAWGIKEIYDINWFDSYIEMPFADLKVRVPIGYHEILTKTYGNYMEFPPIDKQISHHDYYLDLNTPYREYIEKNRIFKRGDI